MARFFVAVVLLLAIVGLTVGQSPRPGQFGQLNPKIKMGAADPMVEDPRPFLGRLFGKQPSKDLDPKVLKDLMDKLNQMPKDQQPDKAQIEELFKNNPAFKDPKFLEQLEKMLRDPDFPKNLEGNLPEGTPVPDKEQGPELAEKLKEVIESGKQGGDPLDPKAINPPKIDPVDPSKLPSPTPDPKSPYADNEWVKWMEKNFQNSPAAQEAVKDFMKSLQKGEMKGMFDDVPGLKQDGWKDIADWGKSNGLDMGKIKPPDVSTGKTGPTLGGGGGGTSLGGGGGASLGGGGVGLAGGGPALLVIAGIAAAFLLALYLFRKWKANEAHRAAQAAAGALGIDFDSIRTREELVRAFDHVSLAQIGEEARSWNHRVIADQFAEVKPVVAEPATELAGLYERARYAPLDEDLSAGDFADARRDLRTISEAPA